MTKANHIDMPSGEAGTMIEARAAGETQRIVSRPHFTVRHTAASDCQFQPHSHNAYVVTAILSGSMSVTIGERGFDLSQGQVALTNLGQSHSGSAANVEFISIGISPVAVGELASEMGLTRTNVEVTFRASVIDDKQIESTARTVAAEISSERVGREFMLEALVRQLAIHLLRSHMTVRKSAVVEMSRAGPVDRRLRRALEFMHDNYSRELALEEIASAAYLSEYHFARLFKQITGVTPHVYLANLRIERGRKLLAETLLAVSEISALVGYHSQSHFTKIFKSITGVTPRVYRDSTRNR